MIVAGDKIHCEAVTSSSSTLHSDSSLLLSVSGFLLYTEDCPSPPSWFVKRINNWSETGTNLPPIDYQEVLLDRFNIWKAESDHALCPISGIYAIFISTRKETAIHVCISLQKNYIKRIMIYVNTIQKVVNVQ